MFGYSHMQMGEGLHSKRTCCWCKVASLLIGQVLLRSIYCCCPKIRPPLSIWIETFANNNDRCSKHQAPTVWSISVMFILVTMIKPTIVRWHVRRETEISYWSYSDLATFHASVTIGALCRCLRLISETSPTCGHTQIYTPCRQLGHLLVN